MSAARIRKDHKDLIAEAKRLGAMSAAILPASSIVVDERVRLKCIAPRCENYGRHLMCPPNLMPLEEFKRALRNYRIALVVQFQSKSDSLDKPNSKLNARLTRRMAKTGSGLEEQNRLHSIVNDLERYAFKRGYYLATGLIGSDCALCEKCVGVGRGACRRPFEARPSMQAMGIDVLKTSKAAGLKVSFSSKEKVSWTGLLLIE